MKKKILAFFSAFMAMVIVAMATPISETTVAKDVTVKKWTTTAMAPVDVTAVMVTTNQDNQVATTTPAYNENYISTRGATMNIANTDADVANSSSAVYLNAKNAVYTYTWVQKENAVYTYDVSTGFKDASTYAAYTAPAALKDNVPAAKTDGANVSTTTTHKISAVNYDTDAGSCSKDDVTKDAPMDKTADASPQLK